jgi:hypothetical protein
VDGKANGGLVGDAGIQGGRLTPLRRGELTQRFALLGEYHSDHHCRCAGKLSGCMSAVLPLCNGSTALRPEVSRSMRRAGGPGTRIRSATLSSIRLGADC